MEHLKQKYVPQTELYVKRYLLAISVIWSNPYPLPLVALVF